MLKLIGPNHFLGNLMAIVRINKLLIAPPKLSRNVGENNWPSNKLAANTRSRLTHAAVPIPY